MELTVIETSTASTCVSPIDHFRYESDLVQAIISMPGSLLPNDESFVLATEVGIGSGTVDLVLAVPDCRRFRHRLEANASRGTLSGHEILTLCWLDYDEPKSLSSLSQQVPLSAREAGLAIDGLLDVGYVEEDRPGEFRRTMVSKPYFTLFVSLEAKLHKWKDALKQATRNQIFSTASYVAMDARHAQAAIAHRSHFQQLGIGLAVVCASRTELEIEWPSHANSLPSQVYRWTAMEILLDRVRSGTATMPKESANALRYVSNPGPNAATRLPDIEKTPPKR